LGTEFPQLEKNRSQKNNDWKLQYLDNELTNRILSFEYYYYYLQ